MTDMAQAACRPRRRPVLVGLLSTALLPATRRSAGPIDQIDIVDRMIAAYPNDLERA
jgi:hypothetical protein